MSSTTGIDWSLYAGAESLKPLDPDAKDVSSSSSSSVRSSRFGDEDLAELKTSQNGLVTPATQSGDESDAHDCCPDNLIPKDPNDFLWVMTEEPHRSRRRRLLQKHPEITKLFGHEPLTKYIVLAVLILHVATPFILATIQPSLTTSSILFIGTAYLLGGTLTQNLFLAIHEITHNLAFRSIWANKSLACVANLGIGIPYAMLFKDYHIEHHKFLGVDGIDTDLPTRLEMLCLQNVLGKTFFCTFQILFYALRPGFVKAQRLTKWHIFNITSILAFDLGYYHFTKSAAPALFPGVGILQLANRPALPLLYLILSAFFAGSLHPCAAHFIAEHYVFDGMRQGNEEHFSDDLQETWSYYGSLNWLTWNVGYHQEHHDFCNIPWSRLPRLHQIAKSTYGALPSHKSWPMVTLKFIFDPRVGLHARVKRASLKPSKTV